MDQNDFVLLVSVQVHILWTVTAKMAKISQTVLQTGRQTTVGALRQQRELSHVPTEKKVTFCKLFTLGEKWLAETTKNPVQ